MFCPNPRCPHFQRTGEAAEYRPGILDCHDCGTPLVEDEPEFGEHVELEEFVPVFRLRDPALVSVVQSLLQPADIHFFLATERGQELAGVDLFPRGYDPVLGPATIFVEPGRAEEARKLLSELEKEDADDPDGVVELATAWFAAWNGHGVDTLPLAPEFVYNNPFGRFEGLEAYFDATESVWGDGALAVRVTQMIVKGDEVVARYEIRNPNGTVEACDWIQIRGDLILEVTSFYDRASLLKSLDD